MVLCASGIYSFNAYQRLAADRHRMRRWARWQVNPLRRRPVDLPRKDARKNFPENTLISHHILSLLFIVSSPQDISLTFTAKTMPSKTKKDRCLP